ncbi:haloacid dehalogenase [Flavobacterium akiainvivens]|uniref:Haloacid dehalogenase n=1 Tax=Flavobacterium akiainvivens TaxID=1202724 RepID=A0A0M8MHN9_9FLAO|nr:YjjG family noncanonical pyrimidine nucleotidase [Flavobacterium akiainvivens]KOS06441.1 haloacid dehalogenase [Flavobacterium akiainvivens]SFQ13477.1 putative hydrolase of the HAD superfamily [Flavobacterium akiainvivens]
MKLSNKKAVFFDLDHTLWDFEKNSALAFEYILNKNSVPVDLAKFIELHVPINAGYWKLFRDGHITQQQLRYGRLKDVFNALEVTVTDELIFKLSEEYIATLPTNNHLYEGAIEVLDYLKPKYSLHIITNGFHTVQEGKIKNANLGHYFDTITNSDLAGCKKPHRDIFEYALRVSGAEREQSVMIGDCIEADVQGALNCGIDAIYFNEHGLEAEASVIQVGHLLELKNLL